MTARDRAIDSWHGGRHTPSSVQRIVSAQAGVLPFPCCATCNDWLPPLLGKLEDVDGVCGLDEEWAAAHDVCKHWGSAW